MPILVFAYQPQHRAGAGKARARLCPKHRRLQVELGGRVEENDAFGATMRERTEKGVAEKELSCRQLILIVTDRSKTHACS